MREQERAKRNASILLELRESASRSWNACAETARVLLALRNDAEFRRLVDDHRGLLEMLPASLAGSASPERADALLHLVVARAVLRPVLVRVEILGWMAHAHPEGLVTLLAIVAGNHGHASSHDTGTG